MRAPRTMRGADYTMTRAVRLVGIKGNIGDVILVNFNESLEHFKTGVVWRATGWASHEQSLVHDLSPFQDTG